MPRTEKGSCPIDKAMYLTDGLDTSSVSAEVAKVGVQEVNLLN